MKAHLVEFITERIEQLKKEYLANVLLLKTYAPDHTIPECSPDMIEGILLSLPCHNCSQESKELPEDYITVKEAMSHLNVSRSTIHRMRKNGVLEYFKHNNTVVLQASDVLQLVETYSKSKERFNKSTLHSPTFWNTVL